MVGVQVPPLRERVEDIAPLARVFLARMAARITVPSLAPPRADAGPTNAERERLITALEQCRWNQGRAAVSLRMSRTTLWGKLREHQVDI